MSIILNNWLPNIFPHASFFISSDIEKGANFLEVILKALKESSIGIFLLTKKNTSAPWIQFEAGAFASKGVESRICPLYIDDDIEIDETGPLRFFQGSLINEKDIFKLLSSINANLETPYPTERLLRLFESNKKEFFYNWDLIKNMQSVSGQARKSTKELVIELTQNISYIRRNHQNTLNVISALEKVHDIKIPREPQTVTLKSNTISTDTKKATNYSSALPDGGEFISMEAYEIATGAREFEYKTI